MHESLTKKLLKNCGLAVSSADANTVMAGVCRMGTQVNVCNRRHVGVQCDVIGNPLSSI